MNSGDATQLFRVRRTVSKMLGNRGYLVSLDDKNMLLDEFKKKFGDPVNRTLMTLLVQKIEDPSDQIFVFFPEDEKVGVKPIKTFLEQMKQHSVFRAIVVCRSITPLAKQALAEMQPKFNLEHFLENELLIDITEHELVPKHEMLSKSEKEELLKRYKLQEGQLPRMRINDPVARYFGMQRGDVVKIIRASETAGRYVTYRIVL